MIDINSFLKDEKVYTAYITGRAGTGKTYTLEEICVVLHAAGISFVVCAYTHKACRVLASKFPEYLHPYICTLHSFLNKRPGINEAAMNLKSLDYNYSHGAKTRPQLLIIDEFSMIGEKDLTDIQALQDPPTDTDSIMKVLMVGDPYQLPPVKDIQSVVPCGKYHWKLTELKRTDKPDLAEAMGRIVSYIEGKTKPQALPSTEHLVRGVNLVEEYVKSIAKEKKLLAYTNKRVQDLNAAVMQRALPEPGDILFCSSTRQELRYLGPVVSPSQMLTPSRQLLELNSKYKSLEYLLTLPYLQFMHVEDTDTGDDLVIATTFGMDSYRLKAQELAIKAVEVNTVITNKFNTKDVTFWSRSNQTHPLSLKRRKLWRECIAFKDCVMQVDFNHAITVHKSQGSTYDEVFVDLDDLAKVMDTSFQMYLRLVYVAISRASQRVYTS